MKMIIGRDNIFECLLYTHSAYINCFNSSNNPIRKLLLNEAGSSLESY